jgi:ubiquinone/menaquinone biosynthesis C-methylase UbiE
VVKSIKKAVKRILNIIHPLSYVSVKSAPYSIHDIHLLDRTYRKMHQLHHSLHEGLIQSLAGQGYSTLLEVACGTGWNIPNFRRVGLEYYGLDISETAIAAASLKHPGNNYLNLGILQCSFIKDSSFDVVYNSSMLEHIGYYREALSAMIRLARRRVYVVFFEGLSEGPDNEISFHPYTAPQIDGTEKDIYGRKVVLQDHVHEKRKGWYWNRYSKKRIIECLDGAKSSFLDNTNTPYVGVETVLIIDKS